MLARLGLEREQLRELNAAMHALISAAREAEDQDRGLTGRQARNTRDGAGRPECRMDRVSPRAGKGGRWLSPPAAFFVP